MENSTEITNEVVESGEQSEVVDRTSHNSDFDLVEATEADLDRHAEEKKEEANGGQAEAVDSHKQNREDNHFAKQARLKAERDAKAKVDRLANEKLTQLLKESGVENPYTDKPFESVEEFTEYGKKVRDAKLKEKAEESGRTIEEVQEEEEAKAYLRNKKKEEESNRLAEQRKAAEEAERSNFFEEDLANFLEAYPDVDVAKLDANENFRKFCGTRYGKEPLAELYTDYLSLVDVSEKAGMAKRDTRNERSTGSGSDGGTRLTAQQQRDNDEWAKRFPHMKMSPSEFMKR